MDTQEVDAVLEACRALVAISASSVESVADRVDLIELRILVVLTARGSASLRELADAARLHLSRASRACERLVGRKLITRTEDPNDRRMVQLRPTAAGDAVVERVTDSRRDAITPLLAAMSRTRRTELIRALGAFTAAAGDVEHRDVVALAWTQ